MSMYFRYIIINSHWKKRDNNLHKVESPPSNDALCQVWFKFYHWLRRGFFIVNVLLLFRYIYSLL